MQTLLSSSFFSFLLPSSPLRGGGAPSFFLRCWAWGGASVLVAERWSGVEREGGGQSNVKGPNGSGSSFLVVFWMRQVPCRVLVSSDSDNFLVAFWLWWCLAAGLLACLGFNLLMLNATSRYITFRSKGGTPVIVTWLRRVGRRLLVQKATLLWSRSCCRVSGYGVCARSPCLFKGVLRAAGELESTDSGSRGESSGGQWHRVVCRALLAESGTPRWFGCSSGADQLVLLTASLGVGSGATSRCQAWGCSSAGLRWCVCCVLYGGSLASLFQGGCRQELVAGKQRSGRRVLLLAANGGGFGCSCCDDVFSCCFQVHAEGCFCIVSDFAGSAGVVYGPTLVVGRGVTLFRRFVLLLIFVGVPAALASKGLVIPTVREAHPLLSSSRDSLLQEFVARQLWWRFVTPYVASSVASIPAGSECELQEGVATVAGYTCYERGRLVRSCCCWVRRQPACSCGCVAKAERAYVWCGLHWCRVDAGGSGRRCPCLVGCALVVGVCAVLVVFLASRAWAQLCAVLYSVGVIARAKKVFRVPCYIAG
ncbi:hypothetical protein Taro_025383 [Colocasia esculenta]|uniref:Uncharacterized protein n=1 Tax=Colocasia esculenta TaxID=4460 RepID=A0A843VHE8_COLES|nr:hypothetical protein [Colocasia esculenta]